VADIIGAGIIPGGMEMMDRPAIHAAEDFVHAGYPLDVEALLIVELDGPPRRSTI
jgi:glycolate oxidase